MSVGRLAVLAVLGMGTPALAGVLFSENFEVDPTANWAFFKGPGTVQGSADYFFDYSTVGIPPAPSGTGTRGLKLQANLTGNVFGGVSTSPIGLNLTGNYILKFDAWANFNGPFPGGGNGSTNLSTFGVGTTGTVVQWPGGVQNSVWFGATGDGGSAADYRAYSTAAPTSYPSGNAVYAAPAGSINNTAAYYSVLGSHSAPAAQLALFPQQTGSTQVGAFGMTWRRITISNIDNVIQWFIDDLLIATVPVGGPVTLAGGNIFFGHSDINVNSSTDPNAPALLFTLIDNIVVVPEPASAGLLLALAGGLMARRRR
ncbi:MAG: PEP-CTERM sorting domain-containing protein [Tepidisphaerales bacterium]